MSEPKPSSGPQLLDRKDLDALIGAFRSRGYQVIGPTLREAAICYGEIGSAADLPAGWTESQEGGSYRLRRRDDEALFGFTVGPISLKPYLHPTRVRLLAAEREGGGWKVLPPPEAPEPRHAFLGVRPCDLRAVAIQDRVLLGGPYPDPVYRARRENCLIVAVNCGHPAGNCFCASMGTGPRAETGYDLALTELVGDGRHVFLVEIGTPSGRAALADVPLRPAEKSDLAAARALTDRAAAHMGRKLQLEGLKEILHRSFEHPRWDQVAARCLTCGNCTQVCPTCFCTTVVDTTDLAGRRAERWRRWDSCFTIDFSYIHGGPVRQSPRSRYRQWLTHKLASWQDQFGSPGCVGCGRCITWCPVGIDITEEAAAIRADDRRTAEDKRGGA